MIDTAMGMTSSNLCTRGRRMAALFFVRGGRAGDGCRRMPELTRETVSISFRFFHCFVTGERHPGDPMKRSFPDLENAQDIGLRPALSTY